MPIYTTAKAALLLAPFGYVNVKIEAQDLADLTGYPAQSEYVLGLVRKLAQGHYVETGSGKDAPEMRYGINPVADEGFLFSLGQEIARDWKENGSGEIKPDAELLAGDVDWCSEQLGHRLTGEEARFVLRGLRAS